MKIDEIKYSLQSLKNRRLRSSLSILSILIGITAIFAIISFGLGVHSYIDTIAEEAGVDKIFIQAKSTGAPGTDPNFFLTGEDIDFVKKINGVDEVAGMYMAVSDIKSKGETKYAFITAFDPDDIDFILEGFATEIEEGRNLKEGDSRKIVLGYNYKIDGKIFSKGLELGNKVEIKDETFKIIGFYEEIGNPGDDANLYVISDTFEELFPEKENRYGYIMLSSASGVDPSNLAEKVEDKLRKFKGQEEGKEDFFVQTFEDALATFSNVINVLNGILVLIAFISLIIATVNIMNTMYTAVLERTKEIGIMKSIGAKNSSIMSIFLFESGVLGFIGGLVGVIFGYIAASIGGRVAAEGGFAALQPIFPWYLILGCLLFATLVGILAGYFPAKRASELRPVESLRYE
jgi:putative ABC transport system permease protein